MNDAKKAKLTEDFIQMVSEKFRWDAFTLDLLTLRDSKYHFSIIIDGAKFGKGDVMRHIRLWELENYVQIAHALNARVKVIPATRNHLSVEFYWESYRESGE